MSKPSKKLDAISKDVEDKEHRKETISFFKSMTTEELIKMQGVAPVADLDEVSALWPADDDPPDFDTFLIEQQYFQTVAKTAGHYIRLDGYDIRRGTSERWRPKAW